MRRPEIDMKRFEQIFYKYGREKQFQPNQYLQEKGTPADHVGYICSGLARAVCTGPEGEDITIFFVKAPNMIGNEALTLQSNVLVTVQAVTPVTLYTLPGELFWQHYTAAGISPTDMVSFYVNRIAIISDYLCCAHIRDNRQRLAYLLHSSNEAFGRNIPYTNEQVAALMGINRITVNRILKEFERADMISLQYGNIRILRPDLLCEIFHHTGYFLE